MLKPVAWKESRELLPLVALALAAQLYILGAPADLQFLFNQSSAAIPFLGDTPETFVFVVAGCAGFVMGLWQTVWEDGRGTYQFLLHRPASRRAIFGTKLLVGLLATVVICVLPMAIYALWAATPGTHASPFRWSMTTWVWQLSARMPLVYLGAFLSGLRPGNWFGSRLFPLAAAVLILFGLAILAVRWPLVSLAVCMAALAAFIAAIFSVGQTRDYS
jgi:hypothetical protein